jgi:putative membrane protein
MVSWMIVAHVFGIMFWVGGLLMATRSLMQHTVETSAEARKALASLERKCLRLMADPGALLTILAGAALVASNPHYYLHAPWLHIKLVFVLGLIGMHGIVGVRTKRYAEGRIQLQPRQAFLLFLAVAVIFLLILIATLPGAVFFT